MMGTAKAREQFQVQHKEKMRERARQQNKDIVPPGQRPVYRGELMSVQERNEYREQLRIIEAQSRDRDDIQQSVGLALRGSDELAELLDELGQP